MIINTAHTKFGDIQYLENDYYIATALKNDIVWEEGLIIEHLQKYIKESNVILDIGAHVGCHSLVYSKLNNDCKIHCFEMQSILYSLLKKNIAANHLHNVEAFHCAIGDAIRMVTIAESITDGPNANEIYNYNDGKEYNFGGISIGPGSEECLMISIDSLQLNACDFIKLDVEGFEYFVIKGGIETIAMFKPVIFYEENHKKLTPYMSQIIENIKVDESSFSTTELLKSLGYNSFERFNDNDVLAKCLH